MIFSLILAILAILAILFPFLHFCFMEKVVIVRHLPHKWGLSLNDDDGLRKGTLLDELTYAFAMRLTEERMTEYYFGLSM